MKSFSKMLMLSILLIAVTNLQAVAQGRSEIAFSLGMGSLLANPGGGSTGVFSFSYRFHISRHFSAEGAIDSFNYKFPTGPENSPQIYKDDYLGAEAAVVYYFIDNRETLRWQPFIAAGIGKTTTDFTEIPAHIYYRLGAGFSYHLSSRLGLQLEARDEIISSLAAYGGSPAGNLPSLRCGIVFRF